MSTESLAVVATGFSVFALVLVVVLAARVGRLTRAYDSLVAGAGAGGSSFVAAMDRHTAEARDLRADVQLLGDELGRARGDRAGAVRHIAVVRYDAFGDLAGALSFSAALLDDDGDGLVLSSINGRSETRTYAKQVQGGRSTFPLSPEEQEAIAEATPALAPSAGARV